MAMFTQFKNPQLIRERSSRRPLFFYSSGEEKGLPEELPMEDALMEMISPQPATSDLQPAVTGGTSLEINTVNGDALEPILKKDIVLPQLNKETTTKRLARPATA